MRRSCEVLFRRPFFEFVADDHVLPLVDGEIESCGVEQLAHYFASLSDFSLLSCRLNQAKKIGEAYHALDDEEKKKYTDAAKEALDQFKREHPDLPKMTRKSKKKEEEKPAKEEGEPAVASASEDEDVDEEKEENLLPRVAIEDKPKPKRPVNAYIRFSNEMRPKIREENPEATPTEMVSEMLLLFGFDSMVDRDVFHKTDTNGAFASFQSDEDNRRGVQGTGRG